MRTRALFVLVLVLTSWGTVHSYLSEAWPFDKLDVRSELIVIAHAVAVEDVARLPRRRLWKGAPAIIVIRTTFEPELVLKGKLQGKTFAVMHHRVSGEFDPNLMGGRSCCQPMDYYVEFPTKPPTTFLMFLVQKDGHYVPVTGSEEESKSVWPLEQH